MLYIYRGITFLNVRNVHNTPRITVSCNITNFTLSVVAEQQCAATIRCCCVVLLVFLQAIRAVYRRLNIPVCII